MADVNDYVRLQDGEDSKAVEMATFNSANAPPVNNFLFTTGNHVYIRFRTDASGRANGFALRYKQGVAYNSGFLVGSSVYLGYP